MAGADRPALTAWLRPKVEREDFAHGKPWTKAAARIVRQAMLEIGSTELPCGTAAVLGELIAGKTGGKVASVQSQMSGIYWSAKLDRAICNQLKEVAR